MRFFERLFSENLQNSKKFCIFVSAKMCPNTYNCMKTTTVLKYGILPAIIACMLCLTACDTRTAEQKTQAAMAKKGGLALTLEASTAELTDSVFTLLSARVQNYGIKYAGVRLTDEGQICAELPGITDDEQTERVCTLLQAVGALEFRETYTLAELLPALSQLLGTDSILHYISLYTNADGTPIDGPAVGLVQIADTAAVCAILASEHIRQLLPADIQFGWSASVMNYEFYELIALRGKPCITSANIKQVEACTDRKTMPHISITLDEQGAKALHAMSLANMDRCIAILVDGAVYMYPRVVSEIREGKCELAGNLTYEQTADLANILDNGPLPASVRITEQTTVNPK